MSHGHYPAPVELSADPAALTTRERRRSAKPRGFGELLPEFGELRTVSRERQSGHSQVSAVMTDDREAVLRLTTAGQRAQQIRLLPGRALVIGRSGVSDLKLRDAALSRTHLKVQLDLDGVSATDLGSTNGSYLRGQAFIHATLQVGSVVVFGQSVLEVVRVSSRSRAAA